MRLCGALALLVVASSLLVGQGVTIRLEPDQEEVGPGTLLSIACHLDNPRTMPLVGYQLYLGYEASVMRAEGVSWPDEAVLGDQTFAAGVFDSHEQVLFPTWRDGAGTDVVSASGFLSDTTPLTTGGLLCVFHFRVLEVSAGVTEFQLDPGPYWSFSGLFGPDGMLVPVSWDLRRVALLSVSSVRDLTCRRREAQVDLFWRPPAFPVDTVDVVRNGTLLGRVDGTQTRFIDQAPPLGKHVYGVITRTGNERGPEITCTLEIALAGPESLTCTFDGLTVALRWSVRFTYSYLTIVRDGRMLARLPGDATSYVDTPDLAGATSVTYTVYGVLAGFKTAEASCSQDVSVQEGIFLRGDTNMDGRRVLSDAVVLLNYLFVDRELVCLDAGDVDDNGRLQITDAIALLSWLFRAGATPPAPPTEAPGPDPTPDGLSCLQGL